jgi:hypothetical protein
MGRRGDGRDDDWRKKRDREDESERDFEQKRMRDRGIVPSGKGLATEGLSSDPAQKLLELLDRSGPLMEQLNNLYAMYMAGVEKRPPIERRQVLESIMQQIAGLPRPTPAIQFRVQTVIASFNTHRDRWDKLLRDRENGKR